MAESTTTTEQSGQSNTNTNEQKISITEYQKLQADLAQATKRAVELEQAQEKQKEKQLETNKEWQALAEKRGKDLEQAEKKNKAILKSMIDDKKAAAVLSELQSLGLRTEAKSDFEHLDLSSVEVETTSTGKLNVLNAKGFAEGVKAIKPHWFGQASPAINSSVPRDQDNSTNGVITPEAIYAAEKQFRSSGKAEDQSKYQAMVAGYTKQRSGTGLRSV